MSGVDNELKEVRCDACNMLLFKARGLILPVVVEIKCPRCKAMNTYPRPSQDTENEPH